MGTNETRKNLMNFVRNWNEYENEIQEDVVMEYNSSDADYVLDSLHFNSETISKYNLVATGEML